jgi:cytochrome c peroxidase
MRKIGIILGFVVSIILIYCNQSSTTISVNEVEKLYKQQLVSLGHRVAIFQDIVESKPVESKRIQDAFLALRLSYKAVELFIDYYNPGTAKAFNGPALFEVDPESIEKPEAPSGLQVIETMIFPRIDTSQLFALKEQVVLLHSLVTRANANANSTQFTPEHIMDAIKLSIIRIQTLGISGFDAPIVNSSLSEAIASLQAIQVYLQKLNPADTKDIFEQTQDAINYINHAESFNTFNRAEFITSFLNPLLKLLYTKQNAWGIPFFKESRGFQVNAQTLFDSGAFNPWFYSPQQKNIANKNMVDLGKTLFYSNLLSSTQTRNCSSCHIPEIFFTDGKIKNNSFDGTKKILRNTPTLFYAALQPFQFADSRLVYLEDQAKQVIENPEEMHGDLALAVKKLNANKVYRNLFFKAFKDTLIDSKAIQVAIAAYIRTLNPFNSPFDKYMRGNNTAMTQDAIEGFNLFMGKAKCGTCHFMPLFSGVVPPYFSTMESEVLGVPATTQKPYIIDPDLGKYNLYRASLHKYAFKTPTIRNVVRTAPYMHNGIFKNLEEVVAFYNKGGGGGLGISIPNQTLPTDSLRLSSKEVKSIIAFMEALTDSVPIIRKQ